MEERTLYVGMTVEILITILSGAIGYDQCGCNEETFPTAAAATASYAVIINSLRSETFATTIPLTNHCRSSTRRSTAPTADSISTLAQATAQPTPHGAAVTGMTTAVTADSSWIPA